MTYKGFNIEYSERDKLHIISYQITKNVREIVGHSLTINDAQKMIDFHLNVEDSKGEV